MTKQAAKAIKAGAKYLLVNTRPSQPSVSQPMARDGPACAAAIPVIDPIDETFACDPGAIPVPGLAAHHGLSKPRFEVGVSSRNGGKRKESADANAGDRLQTGSSTRMTAPAREV